MMKACDFWTPAIIGAVIFAAGYFWRRIRNWYQRRDDTKPDIPEELGWSIDKTDRNILRVALGITILAWLLCWFRRLAAMKAKKHLQNRPFLASALSIEETPREVVEIFSSDPRGLQAFIDSNGDDLGYGTGSDLNMDDLVTDLDLGRV